MAPRGARIRSFEARSVDNCRFSTAVDQRDRRPARSASTVRAVSPIPPVPAVTRFADALLQKSGTSYSTRLAKATYVSITSQSTGASRTRN